MPFIGPGLDNGYRSRFIYTATAGQTSFSGGDANGITLTYTDSEYLDVYQNGVLLVPGDDYAATTGTTVVLVQGASLNDKVEMIQYQAFGVADTVSRADGGAFGGNISTSGTLTVTGDVAVDTNVLKVDTSNNRVGINVTSPSRTLQIAGTDSNRVSSFTHSGDYAFATFSDQNTTNDGSVRVGAYGNDLQLFAGGSARVLIDTNGVVTKPAQPAFLAKVNSDQTNIATNSDVTVLFNVERFDQNADFDTGTYTFTAPVTGRYQLQTSLRLENVDTAGGYYQLKLVTSNVTYATLISPLFSADASYWNMSHAVIADMDASDTAIVKIKQLQGTAQTDIDIESYFSGFLVC